MRVDTQCLVLDSSFMPRSVISSERGFVVYFKGNAEIVHTHDTYFRTVHKEVAYPKPSVIRIYKYIKLQYSKVPLTRVNIYKRDNFSCVYCEDSNKKNLTLDHIIPQSKGGKDTWENLVTACRKCNGEKADLSLKEWGREHPNPRRPHFLMLLKNIEHIPPEWKPFLFY